MESKKVCKLQRINPTFNEKVQTPVTTIVVKDEFLFIARQNKLFKHSLKASKIIGKASLKHNISQVILADPNRVLVFSYLNSYLCILNQDLVVLHHMEFKVKYSDIKDDCSVTYSRLLKSIVLVKPCGTLTFLETLNLKQREVESLKVEETLIRIMATDTEGKVILVAASLKSCAGYVVYISDELTSYEDMKKKPPQGWLCTHRFGISNLLDAVICSEQNRIYLSTENTDKEPEVLVMSISNDEPKSLSLLRAITIPDFTSVSSILVLPWANLLLLGCSKHMVVFAEQTPAKDQSCGKFIVSKIFVHIFQGSCESKGTVDKVMFAQENSLVTVSYKEGINVTEVRVPKTQPKLPIPAFNGFQLVG